MCSNLFHLGPQNITFNGMHWRTVCEVSSMYLYNSRQLLSRTSVLMQYGKGQLSFWKKKFQSICFRIYYQLYNNNTLLFPSIKWSKCWFYSSLSLYFFWMQKKDCSEIFYYFMPKIKTDITLSLLFITFRASTASLGKVWLFLQ